jgi:hypothetical protein
MKKSKLLSRIISVILLTIAFSFCISHISVLNEMVEEFVRIVFFFSSSAYDILKDNITLLFFIVIIGSWFLYLFLQKFNFAVRGNVRYKPYFISRYNILTSKIRRVREIDLPKELLFKKLIEIMPRIGFEIKHSDEKNGTIHAITPIREIIRGEIIYVSLTDINGKSMLEFYSTSIISEPTFSSIYRDRNELNYNNFFREFENSLVI